MAIKSMPSPDFGTMFTSSSTAIAEIQKIQNGLTNHVLGYNGLSVDGLGLGGNLTVKAGSAFEWNSLLWVVDADVVFTISGLTMVFIYFNGTACTLSSTKPTWNPLKRGWYNGNSRALSTNFELLVSQNDAYKFTDIVPPKGSTQTELYRVVGLREATDTTIYNTYRQITLPIGWYKIVMVGYGGDGGGDGYAEDGGNGEKGYFGAGGGGGNMNSGSSGGGGSGGYAETSFFIDSPKTFFISAAIKKNDSTVKIEPSFSLFDMGWVRFAGITPVVIPGGGPGGGGSMNSGGNGGNGYTGVSGYLSGGDGDGSNGGKGGGGFGAGGGGSSGGYSGGGFGAPGVTVVFKLT